MTILMGAPQVPSSSYSSTHFGVVKGPYTRNSEDSKSQEYTGLYWVSIDTASGTSIDRVCMVSSTSYSYSQGVGMFRLPSPGESVLVARTVNNQFYIIGGTAQRTIGNLDSAIPKLGSPLKPISENELIIVGNRTDFPLSQSYIKFSKSGSIRIQAGEYPKIVLSKSKGEIEESSYRKTTWTRSGYEKWGVDGSVSYGIREPMKAPAKWERYVRTREADNSAPFVHTQEGDLEGDRDILTKVDAIIFSKNVNNKSFSISYKSGKTVMGFGAIGLPSNGLVRPKVTQMQSIIDSSSSSITINPDLNNMILRSYDIIIRGGRTSSDRTGKVTIEGRELSVQMTGPISIRGTSEIFISAPNIRMSSNVIVDGTLTVNGTANVNGTILCSGPVFGNPCTWTPN